MRLVGRVAPGVGSHAHWMTVHADLYEAKTGVRLYPGTLNVVLDRAWHVSGHPIRLEPPEYGVGLSIVPCTIGGLDAFILRTDKNDRGDGDHQPNVVEIAAVVRLRDSLGLEDDDEVLVDVASGFVIRSGEPADCDAILTLVRGAFTSVDHDGEEEAQIVRDTWRLQAAVSELDLVAEDGGEIIGHVLGARGAPGSPGVVAVAPLCVRPDRQRYGVGSALMNEVIERAEHQGWPAVVLLGDPGYYGRFGFEAAGPLGVVYETVGADSRFFQILRLSVLDASVRGAFRYCWEVS